MKKLFLIALFFGTISVFLAAYSGASQKSPVMKDTIGEIRGPSSPDGKCKPITCEEAGANCGNISDGCGHILTCGIAKEVSIGVEPQHFSGVCPKIFKFTATVTASKKGTTFYYYGNNFSFDGKGQTFSGSGELVFEDAGTRVVNFEWAVPINLPHKYQYVFFSACGSEPTKVFFDMKCTKIHKPTGENKIPQ